MPLPVSYPCTLIPPASFSYIRMISSRQLSTQKQTRINRFYQFQIPDEIELFPCSLIHIIPRNLESVMRDFFESNSLFVDDNLTRLAHKEYIFTPEFPHVPKCEMMLWDLVSQYFDLNAIVDEEIAQKLKIFIQNPQERAVFEGLSLDSVRFRIVDIFRKFKSISISISQLCQLPPFKERVFAVADSQKCELLIQDIQEERQDPITNVNTVIYGVTSGMLREMSSGLGNVLKPYLDRQGLVAARVTKSPINELLYQRNDLIVIAIGSGFAAIRPLIHEIIRQKQERKIKLFLNLRNKDDLGFLIQEVIQYVKIFQNLQQGVTIGINENMEEFTGEYQIVYCGRKNVLQEIENSVVDAFNSNGVNGEKKWAEKVKYSW